MCMILRSTVVAILVAVPGTAVLADYRLTREEQVKVKKLLAGAAYNTAGIRSGEALNRLVKIIRERRLEVGAHPFEPGEIAHLRLRNSFRGVAFQAHTGKPLGVCLPVELLTEEFQPAREEFNAIRGHILGLVNAGQPVHAACSELQRTVERLHPEYTERYPKAAGETFEKAMRRREVCQCLATLQQEIQTLIDNEGTSVPSYMHFQGQTLHDLVEHLDRHYLEFAPCGCDRKGLATYSRIYGLLLRHVAPLRGELTAELEADMASKAAAAAEERERRLALVHERAKKREESRQQERVLRRYAELWRQLYASQFAAGQYRQYLSYRLNPSYWTNYRTRYYSVPASSRSTTSRTYTYSVPSTRTYTYYTVR